MMGLTAGGCQKKSEQAIRLPSPVSTTYAYIQCIYDSLGTRYVEVDTVQKSFQTGQRDAESIPGRGLPVYSKYTGVSLQWIIQPDAEYTMQTLTRDSSGNFRFNQSVGYSLIRDIFSREGPSRFRKIPFKIIHRDSAVVSIAEEYIP
jgi:hypothetical protein